MITLISVISYLLVGWIVYYISLRLNRKAGNPNSLLTSPLVMVMVIIFWPILLLVSISNMIKK